MTKKKPTRIIELWLKSSKKNKNLCHVIAVLFPCGHKKYLGITKTPVNMKGQFMRVQNARVWTPTEYAITEREGCFTCPNEDFFIKEWPRVEELRDIGEHLDE